MAIKVLIKRTIPEAKARAMIPLFRRMRTLALNTEGYLSGETLRNLNTSEEFIVISNWQSTEHWNRWLTSAERKKIQAEIDEVIGRQTRYEIYHYGFSE